MKSCVRSLSRQQSTEVNPSRALLEQEVALAGRAREDRLELFVDHSRLLSTPPITV
jgi:hypothetical protein